MTSVTTARGQDRTAPLLAPLRRHDPAQVGPYVLLGRLGAGAMGQVYLGRSAGGRLVAVKTIRDEYAEEPDFRDRFAHEVTAARRVSGVFTAAVVAADPGAEVPWLATAYVPAPSLARLVRACGPLPVPAVRWLAAGCAEALESIHSAGLVHRDLKPSNVLVSLDGPQVIDFGVARAAERVSLTATRAALGTPAYMAPEQARDSRRGSAASDVFSLGSTLLYAATGHPPYPGETLVDVLLRVATEPPDRSGLPVELADTVGRCLDLDPARRPTPGELVRAIGSTLRFEDGDGPQSLPGAAVALIEDHRRRPQFGPGGAAEPGSTFGSVPAGTAFPLQHPSAPPAVPLGSPAPAGPAGPAGATGPAHGTGPGGGRGPGGGSGPAGATGPAHGTGRGGGTGPGGGRVPPDPGLSDKTGGWWRGGRLAAGLVAAVAAVVLVAAGVLAGHHLAGRPPAAAQFPGGPPPDGRPPGPPPPPADGSNDTPAGPPEVAPNQPHGDPDTGFVLHGRGWTPGTRVTVRVAGRDLPERPVVDRAGTFNVVAGDLPAGTAEVVVSGADGERATTSIRVDP